PWTSLQECGVWRRAVGGIGPSIAFESADIKRGAVWLDGEGCRVPTGWNTALDTPREQVHHRYRVLKTQGHVESSLVWAQCCRIRIRTFVFVPRPGERNGFNQGFARGVDHGDRVIVAVHNV